MLYISKRVGSNKYAVRDTDDNTETVVSRQYLAEVVRLGVVIEGVTTSERDYKGDLVPCISSIKIAQVAGNETRKQMKAKVLLGVDIIIRDDMIIRLEWDDKLLKDGTFIRLSEFGKCCADRILELRGGIHTTHLGVILDDKIKLRSQTLFGLCQSGVVLDIREVKNERTAFWVYRELSGNGVAMRVIDSIIDLQDRKEKYTAWVAVTSFSNPNMLRFSDAARDFVESKLFDKFYALANYSQFEYIKFRYSSSSVAAAHWEFCRDKMPKWYSNDLTYRQIVDLDRYNIFALLRDLTGCPADVCQAFHGYMKWIEPSERVKELYMKLCLRGYRWFDRLVSSGVIQEG